MPSLNQGLFIEEAILSVLTQETNVELIIIDGGSTDQSVDIIRKYASQLSYWISEPDSGQSEALNKGIGKTNGDIVTWLNSDDRYEAGALKKVLTFFSGHPEIDLLHGRAVLFGNGREKVIGPVGKLQCWEYLPYMRFPQPSSFFRRSLLQNIMPVNPKLHYAMDHELVVKAVLRGSGVAGTDDIFSRYRLHPQSKSVKEKDFMNEWSLVFANALASIEKKNEYYSRLAALKLIPKAEETIYQADVNFSDNEIKQAYLEHLHLRFHDYYKSLEKVKALLLSEEIHRLDPLFARNNHYRTYLFRLRLIPRFIFRIIRTLYK